MIPLFHNKLQKPFMCKVVDHLNNKLRLILSDKNLRNLLLFLLINLSFAFIELFYGMWTNSLGLISDAFHMFFDSACLSASLVASMITKWKSNDKFPFGYARIEVLAGLVNGVFLIFVAVFILSEAFQRAIDPPDVKHERLFVVSLLGFIINLMGIYAFRDSHSHSHSPSNVEEGNVNVFGEDANSCSKSESKSGRSHIMQGIVLHIIADTMGSVGVIVSSLLIRHFNWLRADPICSIIIATLIMLSVIPLIRDTALILMQRQPVSLDNKLPKCYQIVMQLPGVYSIQEPHFWTLCTDVYVGAIKLEISRAADPQYIVNNTQSIFVSNGVRHLYIQLDYAASSSNNAL